MYSVWSGSSMKIRRKHRLHQNSSDIDHLLLWLFVSHFLISAFSDAVLPRNLLQSRSWQTQGNPQLVKNVDNSVFLPLLALCDWQLCPPPTKAAKIPLSSELGIDEFHFNDFSLDNDAMITASLRMFLELGVVQKFKIDYEVRVLWCVC